MVRIQLVQLHVHGSNVSVEGDWSDGDSVHWTTAATRQLLDYRPSSDDENHWISGDDFANYKRFYVCRIFNVKEDGGKFFRYISHGSGMVRLQEDDRTKDAAGRTTVLIAHLSLPNDIFVEQSDLVTGYPTVLHQDSCRRQWRSVSHRST